MSIFDRFHSKEQQTSLQDNSTMLNPQVESGRTVINPSLQSNQTVINPDIDSNTVVASGTTVCGKYIIKEKLNVSTGEADLFICTCGGKSFIAKIYRRRIAIKPEVVQSLLKIRSPYVARIYDIGEYNGYPVEIIPLYRNGSLQGHKFSIQQLKDNIIPSLNEGLKALHDQGIIHKDLKPANIMLNDDGKTVSIIDFGVSVAVPEGNTYVVTSLGLTLEYTAPETHYGLFLPESDYYSLGITLFELFFGYTPYKGLSQEEIARFSVIQKVPLPDHMDANLKALIVGLTYNDITNRHDKHNPNRRWTYKEVSNWCHGVSQPIPGSTAGESPTGGEFRAFRFEGEAYDTMDSLVNALGTHWDSGKKQLFRGTLAGHFNSIDAEIATICGDAQDSKEDGDKNDDVIFFETLYKMDPGMHKLFWKGHVYSSLNDFAEKLLTAIRTNDAGMDALVSEMLTHGILSSYIESIAPDAAEQIKAIKAFESAHRSFGEKGIQKSGYQLGYMLADRKALVVDGKTFYTVDDIVAHMKNLLDKSYEKFDTFCNKLLHKNDELDIQFDCWLCAQGKKSAIDEWRKELFV